MKLTKEEKLVLKKMLKQTRPCTLGVFEQYYSKRSYAKEKAERLTRLELIKVSYGFYTINEEMREEIQKMVADVD